MALQDQTLVCADCGKNFVFTAGEQEFYQQRGFTNTPKRCEDCRSKRKAQSSGRRPATGGGGERGGKSQRPKYSATCSRCGVTFDAPFEPKPGRPIFCRDCFESSKGGGQAAR